MIAKVSFEMQVPNDTDESRVREEFDSVALHIGPAGEWWNVIDSSVYIDLISDNPGQSPESAESE